MEQTFICKYCKKEITTELKINKSKVVCFDCKVARVKEYSKERYKKKSIHN